MSEIWLGTGQFRDLFMQKIFDYGQSKMLVYHFFWWFSRLILFCTESFITYRFSKLLDDNPFGFAVKIIWSSQVGLLVNLMDIKSPILPTFKLYFVLCLVTFFWYFKFSIGIKLNGIIKTLAFLKLPSPRDISDTSVHFVKQTSFTFYVSRQAMLCALDIACSPIFFW